MAIEETTSSIWDYFKNRTVSPLFGAFAVSWCLWNYKLLHVLIFSDAYETKFSYIRETLYNKPILCFLPPEICNFFSYDIFHLIIWPFISAIVFLLIYPIPARYVYKHWRTEQSKLNDLRRKIDGEALKTVDEFKTLEKQFEEKLDLKNKELRSLGEEHNKNLHRNRDYQKEIERLRTAIKGWSDKFPLTAANAGEILFNRRFRFVSNPKENRSFIITFNENGKIDEGRSKYVVNWRIENNALEILAGDESIFYKFYYREDMQMFFGGSNKSQYILPVTQDFVPDPKY